MSVTNSLVVALDASVMELKATGVAKSTIALYQACARLDDTVRVTALHHRPLTCQLPPGIGGLQLGERWPGRVYREVALPLALLALRPDVAHFPWNGAVPRLRPRIGGRPLIVTTVHDVLPLQIPRFFAAPEQERAYRQRLAADLARTDLVVTVSQYSANQIMSEFTVRAEPLVLTHGPTLEAPAAPRAIPGIQEQTHAGGPFFLYVGGYDPRKGLAHLLQVFSDLRRGNRLRATLVLTGEPHYFSPEFRSMVELGRAAGWLEERGYVSDQELAILYGRALALTYPSRYEGFGLPPLEAMALGCPVITTRGTSLPEVCGDAALYVDLDEPRTLAEALIAVAVDPSLRKELAARGRRQASRFSWESSAARYLDALGRLRRRRHIRKAK